MTDSARLAFALLVLVLAAVSASASDLSWIEREWVSDANLSERANPCVRTLDPDALARFRSLFGKTRWRFQDGVFTGSQTDIGYQSSSPYYIRPAEEGRWEIVYQEGTQESGMTVWKMQGGLCGHVSAWLKEKYSLIGPSIIECYVPADAEPGAAPQH